MATKEQINKERLPGHVAIIMDGNGRWAKKRGNQRIFGHKEGVKSVRETVEAAADLGISHITLYAFSRENWNRPKHEIEALMSLLISTIDREIKTLIENNIRLLCIGDITGLPDNVRGKIAEAKKKTENNTGLNLVLALNYSARWELAEAMRNFGNDVKQGRTEDDLDNDTVKKYLTTKDIPDPDLLIRTSGECRLSNFLLWQLAYTELYFTEVLWPDFRKENFYEAIVDYQNRERRFGKTSGQLKDQNESNKKKNNAPHYG
ncbi:MAG: isoprenyl transferase [Bacteroidales bacterium]|nr:isoprenyl transferase [Bacteroidales bacterium]